MVYNIETVPDGTEHLLHETGVSYHFLILVYDLMFDLTPEAVNQ